MMTNEENLKWWSSLDNRARWRDTVRNIALAEVGYDETPVNRTKYGEWYGMNGSAWCAMFCSWVHGVAADKLGVHNPLAGLQSAKGYAHVTSTWALINKAHPEMVLAPKDSPMVGDLFFWDHNSLAGGPGHTGMMTDFQGRRNMIISGEWVEGNTNDKFSRTGGSVCKHNHAVKIGRMGAHGYLLGVVRPTRRFWSKRSPL